MGFLRKVGRKVKKKLNKVFGEKVGGILGMVGLYFAMGAVAKGLSGWAKSTFGAGKSTADVANVAQQASEVSKTAADVKSATDSTAVITEAAKKGVDATVTSTGASVETLIAESTTNAEKFNSWVGGQESLLNQGKLPVEVNPSLTDTVVNSISNEEVYKQTTGEVFKYLEQPALDVNRIAESVTTAEQAATASQTEMARQGIDFTKGITSPKASIEGTKLAQESATGFQKFTTDPIGSTVDYVGTKAKEAGDYVKSGAFVPDIAEVALTTAANNALMEKEEVMGFGRPAQGQPMMTAAQGNHLAAVQAQPGYANLTNMRSFTDLANQTLYGTGSPSYLQNVYQPIKI
jgi:hypothetical protein